MMVTQNELRNVSRSGHTDGSDGDIPGCDLRFEFAGRRWEYRCAYDRYDLVEIVGGLRLTVSGDTMGCWWIARDQALPARGLETYFLRNQTVPADRQVADLGLVTTSWTDGQGTRNFNADRPLDADARRLSESRTLLDQLVCSRVEENEDRTGYHKADAYPI